MMPATKQNIDKCLDLKNNNKSQNLYLLDLFT